ncbi:MAG: anaerobic glycerol-3-phosphate dehydrogenase subunit A [Alistipes sp.]|nr:anaerobic glycerol-3-phosphate dehydrogenase subunit A [Alistipes sp.]
MNSEFDVIIIGGGATGAGVARDCALRGIRALLIERHDIATGATGRNHGLLHSGARYAVNDRESAEECIKENMILRRIASHCVEDTGGLFITLPEDSLEFQAKFIESCLAAGISAEAIDPKQAMLLEPSVNPTLIGAVKVPDGSVDPFRLTAANIMDARLHGAKVLTYTRVDDLIVESGRVVGVKVTNTVSGEKGEYRAAITVNACGIWGRDLAAKAGVTINMLPAKGALLVFGHRVNNVVINRCRKPADADILVPGDNITVIGTTSSKIPFDQCDNMYVTREEVDLLLREGSMLAPALNHTRILRAYAGVRPLVASDDDPSGRSVSRGIVVLDHATRDGVEGFVTITGGKLMTYRLMAEWTVDLICKKLNIDAKCTTAEALLPGAMQKSNNNDCKRTTVIGCGAKGSAFYRHGTAAEKIDNSTAAKRALVCECEQVSVGEVEYAVENLGVNNLVDLRRRTRVGMGTCQGELCACRAASVMAACGKIGTAQAKADLKSFVTERWKGMSAVAWGDTMREGELLCWLYDGVCDLSNQKKEE